MATYAASSPASSQTSPYNIARPTGTVSGTYMVAAISNDIGNDGSGIGITGGTTWNPLTSGLLGQTGYRLFWKIAGASEPANYSVSYNAASSAYSTAHIITSNDAGVSAPVWQVTTTSGAGTTGPTPGITPADDATLEVRVIFASASAARTWTSPVGLTERTDVQQTNFPTGSSATRTLASSAATSSLNFTASGSVDDRVGITVGIPKAVPPLQSITPSAIDSGEAFGTAQLNLTIAAQGIASGEAFGTLTTSLFVTPGGIASGEAFGDADLTRLLIAPLGIPSAEAHGSTNVAIEQFITPGGIASRETFGDIVLQIGYPQDIFPEGIESAEVVEDPTIRNVSRLVLVNPSIQETPAAWNALHGRYGLHRGITIMKSGGVWRSVRYPAQTELEDAERFYMGGRRHTLSVGEAEELISAGYGAYITLEPDD